MCKVRRIFQPVQGNLWRCTHTRESQVEIQKYYRTLFRERKGRTTSRSRCRRRTAAPSKLSDAKYHTIILLEEQRNRRLSEARSQMDVQELTVGSADMALRESSLQIHSQRMELNEVNQSSDHSPEKKLVSELFRKWKN